MDESFANGTVFQERPTAPVVADAYALAAVPAGLAVLAAGLGALWAAGLAAGLTLFVPFFFRNPTRRLPGEADAVVAPADGRVIEVGEVEDEKEGEGLRIGIFLSLFNVHVNRAPLSGRVVAVERRSGGFRAAFDPRAEHGNARTALVVETGRGERVRIVQIAGLLARRIVCHPRVGEWLPRGARYGLIRFGSRTDVVLPSRARACVVPGQRVRGGSSVVARLGVAS